MVCSENLQRNLEDAAEMIAEQKRPTTRRMSRRSSIVNAQSIGSFGATPSTISERTSESSKLANVLSIVVLVLVAVLVIAWSVKANQTSEIAQIQPMPGQDVGNYPQHPQYPQYPESTSPGIISQIQQDQKMQQQTIGRMWERQKWATDRLTLMAMLTNHNTAVSQYNYPKSDMVYLNPDWTIDKMPKYLDLDRDDRVFLQQFMRAGESE